ncbi:MAG: transposase [Opitutales bacterium]|nr:transposase [Opitutales bacterium]MCH8539707.1 transposase [Opitutales bacterium]
MKRVVVEKGDGVYHVMSRTVNGEKLLGPKEKAVMRRMLFRAAGFSGVEILTYCLMSNHFHVLVKVPDKQTTHLNDNDLIARYSILYEEDQELRTNERAIRYQPPTPQEVSDILKRGGEEAIEMRKSLLLRMHDLSQFVKTFKQRFAIWLNVHRKRFGPLWNERFRSVLVEPSSRALLAVAAYIELNPVRAGLVDDPGKYNFSGYGEARNRKSIRPGLKEIIQLYSPQTSPETPTLLEEYGNFLLGRGSIEKEGQSCVGDLMTLSGLLSERPPEEEARRRHWLAPLNRGIILGSIEFVYECASSLLRRGTDQNHKPPKNTVFEGIACSQRRFWKK